MELNRRWPLYLLIPVMMVGLGIGLYMTWHHDAMLYGMGEVEIVGCAESNVVSCDQVNTSKYSEVLGIPIAIFTGPTYLLVLVLAVLALLKKGNPRKLVGYQFGIGILSVIYSVFLGIISKFELGFICLWCFRLYAVNISIFVLSWLYIGLNPINPVVETIKDLLKWPKEMKITVVSFLVLTAFSFGGERIFRGSLIGDAPALGEGKASFEEDFSQPCPVHSWEVDHEDEGKATLTLRSDDAWRGNRDSEVVVVEFGDFPCPYCKKTDHELTRLYEVYGDRVLFVFKHYPMSPSCNKGVRNNLHPTSCEAQKASVCAQLQGKFWEYHDIAYKNNQALKPEYLRIYAEQLDLDMSEFEQCMAGPASVKVHFDAEAGRELGIHGIPRIFINGKRYKGGQSAESMAKVIEAELGLSEEEGRLSSLKKEVFKISPIPVDVQDSKEIEYGALKFHIDTFEASSEGVSKKGEIPAHQINWYEAKAICEKAGKRLCTEQEWVSACQGALAIDDDNNKAYADDIQEGSEFSYGDVYQPQACYTGKNRDRETLVYTGENPGCVSKNGIYDLIGNVEEWVGLTEDEAVLLGGAFDTKEGSARCYRRNDTFGPGFKALRTGVRCCADHN